MISSHDPVASEVERQAAEEGRRLAEQEHWRQVFVQRDALRVERDRESARMRSEMERHRREREAISARFAAQRSMLHDDILEQYFRRDHLEDAEWSTGITESDSVNWCREGF